VLSEKGFETLLSVLEHDLLDKAGLEPLVEASQEVNLLHLGRYKLLGELGLQLCRGSAADLGSTPSTFCLLSERCETIILAFPSFLFAQDTSLLKALILFDSSELL